LGSSQEPRRRLKIAIAVGIGMINEIMFDGVMIEIGTVTAEIGIAGRVIALARSNANVS
jgi:hypothetical protein